MSLPVVVLHGFTGSGTAMAPLTDRLMGDPNSGEAISPDLAGHGLGVQPTELNEYTIDAMAAVMAGLVEGPIHLVGYSMGGRVALTLACQYPERVASLSLIGASAGLAGAHERAVRAASDDALADELEANPVAFIDRWMRNPLFVTQERLGSAAWEASRAQRLANDPRAMACSLRMGSTGRMTPLHNVLAACAMPVGVIVGSLDEKFRGIAADLAFALPDAEIVVIADSGHATHVEQPDATAAAVVTTIRRAQ
ncbi:MAG: alpha/beta fold hydrolase [Acidimicrobiales bacterium]|nr:alpha/beta fold hydrolase [Acidimicrobiales bacterium]